MNYLIINRKPIEFDTAKITSGTALFLDKSGNLVEGGAIDLDDSVYAALFCDEVHNVTLVLNEDGKQTVVTMIWSDEDDYGQALSEMKANCKQEFSMQNLKINRYAEELAGKLAIGVEIKVIDAVDESKMVTCPECGMMNDPGSPYCLECGADL